MHDGDCWQWVASRLRASGHAVETPSLPMNEGTTFADHVDVVSELVDAAKEAVVLVGHSFGGQVVTASCTALPSKVRALVLLDAVIAERGRSGLDAMLPRWLVPLVKRRAFLSKSVISASALGIDDAGRAAWLREHLYSQPIRTISDPFPVEPHFPEGRTHFLQCTRSVVPFASGGIMAKMSRRARQLGLPVQELAVGHGAMISHDELIADVLNDLGMRTTEAP